SGVAMHARQAVIVEPFRAEVREVELPAPAANQVLVATEASAISAGTELAVWTGTHQWLKDPSLPDWKFPFRPGYSAAGTIVAVLGLGVIGQFALRCLLAAGAFPVVGIDAVAMRRAAAMEAGAHHVIDPGAGDVRDQLSRFLGNRGLTPPARQGVEIVADATG